MKHLNLIVVLIFTLFSSVSFAETINLIVTKNSQGNYELTGQVTPKEALIYLKQDKEVEFTLFEKTGDELIELNNEIILTFIAPSNRASKKLEKSHLCKKLARWKDGMKRRALKKKGQNPRKLKFNHGRHDKSACYNYKLTVVGLEQIEFDPWIIIRK